MPERQCGPCQLCCRLLPVVELGKHGGERCRHQRHRKGCAVYRARPVSCSIWSCLWLLDPEMTHTLLRPDLTGYVLDPAPDKIEATSEDGKTIILPVLQIWCDPKRKDAHKDPGLRALLDGDRILGIVRHNQKDGFVLAPPSLSADHAWMEMQKSGTLLRDSCVHLNRSPLAES